MTEDISLSDGSSIDTLFAGQLVLRQLRHGHRAGTDTVLLAAAGAAMPVTRFIDAGAGSGAVGLWLGLRNPEANGVLLEGNTEQAALARDNTERNGLAARVSTVSLDLFDKEACREAALLESADLVVSNPPFYSGTTVRASPDVAKASAHVLPILPKRDGDPAAAWARRLSDFLKPKGRFLIVHRTAALPILLRAMEPRCGSFIVQPIHAKAGEPAIRILLTGVQGGRAPLVLLPPIVLHEADGSFTEAGVMLHAGVVQSTGLTKNQPRRAGPFRSKNDQ